MEALIGVDVTKRTTTAEFPPGSLYTQKVAGQTDRVFMYIQSSGVTAAGNVVIISGGINQLGYSAANASVTSTAPGTGQGKLCAVAETAFAINEYGWALIYGSCTVSVLANAAAWTQLNSTGTSGSLDDDATAGSEVIEGIVLRAANGGSTALTNALITFPRVGRTL